MKKSRRNKDVAAGMLGAFLLWTVAVRCVDVKAIGPLGSMVGFATVNRFVHDLTGVHMPLYILTDWLSLIPLGFAIGFACLGMVQWIRRKHLLKVDRSILVLGGFYAVVIAVYALFETVVVNYRPVLIEGVLEASYPSSTTMFVVCVMQTAVLQLRFRMRNEVLKRIVTAAMTLFSALMVIGRLISGVHWITDIIAGLLLSGSLMRMYRAPGDMDFKS